MQAQLELELQRFQANQVHGPFAYQWHHHFDGKQHDLHLLICGLIHGNEVGSLPGINKTMQDLANGNLKFGGKVTFVLGNPEAARINQRFIESDLNRVFLDNDLQTHEANRAREIMPIIDTCDFHIDFHQTILHTERPFYIFPHSQEAVHFAQTLALSNALVDSTPAPDKPITTQCTDDYARAQGKTAITIELSQKGFHPEAFTLSTTGIRRAMHTLDQLALGAELGDLAKQRSPLETFYTSYREPYHHHALRLRPGLYNFSAVKKGEKLHAKGTPALTSPSDGYILFPKYPPPGQTVLPKEIYRLIRKS